MENFSVPEYPKSSREPAQSSDALSQDQHSYPKIFVQCSLPYRNPQEYFWQRYNGDTTLTLTAGSYLDAQGQTHMHLPYGIYPRIILMYLASEALRTRSREIQLPHSVWALLRDMGVEWPGGARARDILKQLRAVLAMSCEMTITRTTDDGSAVQEYSKFLIGERGRIHFSLEGEDLHGDYQSTITLSTGFYEYLCSGAMPVMTTRWRDLIAHTKSPLAADIFLWLSSRLPSVQSDTRISWDQLAGQFGSNTAAGKKFRERFRLGLEHALSVYPEALVSEVGAGARSGFRGLILHPSPGSDLTGLHWAYQPRPLTGDSTAEDPPGDTPAPPPSSEVYRGVDLTQLRADLSTVGITTEGTSDTGLQRAIGTILTRAASPVGSPQRYVTVAITADPTLLTGEALTAAAIRAATHREAPSPSTPATEGNSSLPTGGICSICYDPYNGAVCPSCAAELISADPIPTDILTELWEALKDQLQGAGHNPGSNLYTRYENAYQYHTQNDRV